MSGYDIYGIGVMLAVTGLAVDQGWTVFFIGQIVFCLFMFLRLSRKDRS